MTLVDDRGRLFGRINLVDAAIVVFAIALIPVAYGTYLLFRPARPRIDSVTRVEIGKEERRIGGSALMAKFKVAGTGFNPLMRVWIGSSSTPAIGFVFENPNSADVLVGVVPIGTHDLILVDGVQEVARAPGAVTVQDTEGTSIRAVGWLTNLDPGTAKGLHAGFTSPKEAPGTFEIVTLGPVRPARSRITVGASSADTPVHGLVEREAVLTIRCDSPAAADSCSINGATVTGRPPVAVNIAGGWSYLIHEVLPTTAPRKARAQIRFSGPQVALMRAGDRDAFLDARAAVLSNVGGRESNAITVTLEMGVDDSREGWRYRGRLLRPGAELGITTDRYEAVGQIISVDVAAGAAMGVP
jgi:hypothetical protein